MKNILTDKEREYILSNKDTLTINEIATALGRSYYTVRRVLSLSGHKSIHRWSEEDDNILRVQYGIIPTDVIAYQIGVDIRSVQNRAQRLGIIIKPEKRVKGRKEQAPYKMAKSVIAPRKQKE